MKPDWTVSHRLLEGKKMKLKENGKANEREKNEKKQIKVD